jgi:hypothetical protein
MNPPAHPILTEIYGRHGKARVRFFGRNELNSNEVLQSGWVAGESLALDKPIMDLFPHLWFWARPLMPKELEKEREEMLIQNLTCLDALTASDEFDIQHQHADGRLIVVGNRKGVRFKFPLFLGGSPAGKYIIAAFSDQQISHIENCLSLIGKEGRG